MPHRILDGRCLVLPGDQVALGPAEARQQERGFATRRGAAVERCGDEHGEAAASQRPRRERSVGTGRCKVTSEREQNPHPLISHRPDRCRSVEPGRPRGDEAELALERVEELRRRPVGNTDRGLTLHVAVPAHRAGARARAADVAT